MSGTSSNAAANRKAKNGRGSTNNTSRLAGFQWSEEKRAGAADWSRADPRWIAGVVTAACSAGIEISFSYTKGAGAHGLKMYDFGSGERVQLWFNGDADLDAELERVFYTLGGQ